MDADSSRRPARALLALFGALWPLLAAGGFFAVARLTPLAANFASPDAAPTADPRQDRTLSLPRPSASTDALYLPLAAFQRRRYRAALRDLAAAPKAPEAPRWRRVRDGSLYTYRMQRMKLTAEAVQVAHLPDL